MNTTLYWMKQAVQNKSRKVRRSARLWWLNQQIEFLAWRWRQRLA
jgi:hypothetical protein